MIHNPVIPDITSLSNSFTEENSYETYLSPLYVFQILSNSGGVV